MTDSKKLSPEELQGPDKTWSGLLCRTQELSILFQGELSRSGIVLIKLSGIAA